ncbi:hypothetical protein Ocin01_14133, partial [Orchesella cincta]
MGTNELLRWIGMVDFVFSFAGIPAGTYFLYTESWWSSLGDFGVASSLVLGMGLSSFMCVASACLYVAGTDSATVNETMRYINCWYGTSLSFTVLVALAGIMFVPLSYENPWLWALICVGLSFRCLFHYCLVQMGVRPTWNQGENTIWELTAIDV